jgi:hypothetical protein
MSSEIGRPKLGGAGDGFGGQSWGKTSTLDRAEYYCYNDYIASLIPPSNDAGIELRLEPGACPRQRA